MEFTQEEKRLLQQMGRTEDGKDLVKIFKRAKAHYSSIEGIDGKADYGAQVEGRKLFGTFIDVLTRAIEVKPHRIQEREADDYT